MTYEYDEENMIILRFRKVNYSVDVVYRPHFASFMGAFCKMGLSQHTLCSTDGALGYANTPHDVHITKVSR